MGNLKIENDTENMKKYSEYRAFYNIFNTQKISIF